jgi:hypothetical protein
MAENENENVPLDIELESVNQCRGNALMALSMAAATIKDGASDAPATLAYRAAEAETFSNLAVAAAILQLKKSVDRGVQKMQIR